MIHYGTETKLDGAVMYACPFDVRAGENYFYNNALGFYGWVIGLNLVSCLNK